VINKLIKLLSHCIGIQLVKQWKNYKKLDLIGVGLCGRGYAELGFDDDHSFFEVPNVFHAFFVFFDVTTGKSSSCHKDKATETRTPTTVSRTKFARLILTYSVSVFALSFIL